MKFLSPVVWSEGMHLAQHHFQTQNRYFEELTRFAVDSLFYGTYGLVRCELDADALLNGTVSLGHARGIMPDGLAFEFPEDVAPEPLEIADLFSPVHDSHLVLLAIPPLRAGHANCAADGQSGDGAVRFGSAPTNLPDELTGGDEKEVELARKNFRLLLDQEEHGDLVVMPIARVRRDGRGHFVYDPEYVPPCLQIGASDRLLRLGERLTEMLEAKSEAMRREREATQRPLAEWAAREVANFWLTHSVNAAVSPLKHMLATRAAHPERMYVELARLAGALCTFSLDAHPRDLPSYDHDDPAPCFDALDRHIRRNLEVIIPSNALVVALEETEANFHTGTVADERAFGGGALWYLGVRSSSGRGEISAAVPRLVKVCSAEHIMRLVKEGLPGLTLEHEPSPPPELSPRIGSHYFRIRTDGPCWTLMVKTHNAGVYSPAAIADAELELTIVLEEGRG
jgi:type VI secretion system protein ImpJ